MRKEMKENQRYFIINIKEPYAKAIYEVLKAGQIAKNEWPEGDISFEEWIEQTWPTQYCGNCVHLRDLHYISTHRTCCQALGKALHGNEPGKEVRLQACIDDDLREEFTGEGLRC